jgi:hypothetical protein
MPKAAGLTAAVRPERLAGAAGLLFTATVVFQNLLRGSGPLNDASPAAVAAYYSGHHGSMALLLASFGLGFAALLTFVAGLSARAQTDEPQGAPWARLGLIGGVLIACTFTLVNVFEVGIDAAAVSGASPAVLTVIVTLYWAAFGINLLSIGTALLGLSQAAARARLIPRWLGLAGLLGGPLLIAGGMGSVAIANGSHWLIVGLVGFIVWLVFVITASVALLRCRPAAE